MGIINSSLQRKLTDSGDVLFAPKFNPSYSFKKLYLLTAPTSNNFKMWPWILIPSSNCSFLVSFALDSCGQWSGSYSHIRWLTSHLSATAVSEKESLCEPGTDVFPPNAVFFSVVLVFYLWCQQQCVVLSTVHITLWLFGCKRGKRVKNSNNNINNIKKS